MPGREPMTASGTSSLPPSGAIAARPTASPLPFRAAGLRRPAAARSPAASAAAALFPSIFRSAPPGRAAAAGWSADPAQAAGAGSLPATDAAAPGRPRAIEFFRTSLRKLRSLSRKRHGCPGKIFQSRNKRLQQRRLWKFLALSTRDCELESFESLESFPGTAVRLRGRVPSNARRVGALSASRNAARAPPQPSPASAGEGAHRRWPSPQVGEAKSSNAATKKAGSSIRPFSVMARLNKSRRLQQAFHLQRGLHIRARRDAVLEGHEVLEGGQIDAGALGPFQHHEQIAVGDRELLAHQISR